MGAVNEGCWTCHPVESIEGHRISLCTERRCTTTRYRHPVWRGWRFYLKKKEKMHCATLLLPQIWHLEQSVGNRFIVFFEDFFFFRRLLILSIRSIKSLKICCVRTACFADGGAELEKNLFWVLNEFTLNVIAV